jgi:ribonuclease P protein component
VHVRLHAAGETHYAPWVEALRFSGHHAVVGYATRAVASARRSCGVGGYALQGYGVPGYDASGFTPRGYSARGHAPQAVYGGYAPRPEAAPAGCAPQAMRPRRKDNALLTSDSAAPARLTLPAQRRLRRKSDFDAAYAGGRKFGNGFFGVTAFWNDKGWARLGLAVAVRTAGGGVERNRIRRIIRESFRLHQHELPGVDLIVSARGRAKDAPGPELHASLVALWIKVKEQCATSPRS